MRVLSVNSLAIAHPYPLVTTAWAARAGDHDVLVATCASTAQWAARADLPVAAAADLRAEMHAMSAPGALAERLTGLR